MRSTRRRSPGSIPSPGRSTPTRCCSARTRSSVSSSWPPPSSASSRLEPWLRGRSRWRPFLELDYGRRQAVCIGGLRLLEPDPAGLGGRRRGPVHGVLRRRPNVNRTAAVDRNRGRLPADGPSGNGAARLRGLLLRRPPAARADGATRAPSVTERVDVCIVGSGSAARSPPGGSRSSTAPPVEKPSVVVLERGLRPRPHRLPPVDGRRAPLRRLRADPGPGCPDRGRRTSSAAGRTSTWRPRCGPRRDLRAHRRPAATTARAGGCGRSGSAARRSTATTRAPRRACGSRRRRGTGSRSRAASGRRCCARPASPATGCRSRSARSAA